MEPRVGDPFERVGPGWLKAPYLITVRICASGSGEVPRSQSSLGHFRDVKLLKTCKKWVLHGATGQVTHSSESDRAESPMSNVRINHI